MKYKQVIRGRNFATNSEGEGVFELVRGAYMQHRGTSQTPRFKSADHFRRYVLEMTRDAHRAGGKRTAKRSSNRAGSMSSRKVSAAARRHVDDLISMGRSASEVASDPRPLETWEGWAILEAAGLPESASGEQYAAARRALAAAIRAYAGKLSRSKSNRAGTKRRNRAGMPKRSARTGRFLKAR